MEQPDWKKAHDRESLARDLAAHVASLLIQQLGQSEGASLAVSGGSTPTLLFQYLSRCDLPWHRVAIVPVDERWVVAGSDQANESLIRTHLLQNKASAAPFLSLLGEVQEPELAARRASRQLAALEWPLTVVLMGMGSDGHTASWFPGDPASVQALADNGDAGYCVTQAPSPPRTRLTLTWPCIRDAGHRILLIHGEDKRRVLEDVVAGDEDESPAPVLRLLERPLSIFWSP